MEALNTAHMRQRLSIGPPCLALLCKTGLNLSLIVVLTKIVLFIVASVLAQTQTVV